MLTFFNPTDYARVLAYYRAYAHDPHDYSYYKDGMHEYALGYVNGCRSPVELFEQWGKECLRNVYLKAAKRELALNLDNAMKVFKDATLACEYAEYITDSNVALGVLDELPVYASALSILQNALAEVKRTAPLGERLVNLFGNDFAGLGILNIAYTTAIRISNRHKLYCRVASQLYETIFSKIAADYDDIVHERARTLGGVPITVKNAQYIFKNREINNVDDYALFFDILKGKNVIVGSCNDRKVPYIMHKAESDKRFQPRGVKIDN